jgi:hypothetical protein
VIGVAVGSTYEGVGVAVGVDDEVGVRVAEGVADAEAEVVVFAVVNAACGVLLAAWLVLVDDVQPAIDSEAIKTNTMIAKNFFSHSSPP